MSENNPKYKVLFSILDAIFATIDFIRMAPWYLWDAIQFAYILTIYRAIVTIQIKLNLRRLKARQ